jgi:eukaryotic translation initiation factor 2C
MANKRFKRSPPKEELTYSWLELRLPGKPPFTNKVQFFSQIENGIQSNCGVTIKVREFPDFQHSRVLPPTQITAHQLGAELKILKAKATKLVFIILPNKSAENYAAVKISADVLVGIHTICTVRKPDGSVKASAGEIANLILKFNQKLGGINLIMEVDQKQVLKNLLSKRLMFVGADVGHPSPSSMDKAPSIASLVATTDQSFFQYAGSVRLQTHRDKDKKSVESILQIDVMMIERLELYQKRNKGTLPEIIFMYRDGVADQMFGECVNKELPLMKKACKTVYKEQALPKLVYIVVQKRHHTRFYKPDNDRTQFFDKNGNVVPGFIIDNQITDHSSYDWYGVSHICLQGTSRPAHYTTLFDEAGLSVDELQFLVSTKIPNRG